MKLAQASEGHVVRNSRNGSHYRFVRTERGKARIYPLELFPTGLLIAKPTPTLVEADLEVTVVGPWFEGMVAPGRPTRSRAVYERELVEAEAKLDGLVRDYELLPVSGVGKLSRGSWANKVKNARMRVETLKRGLGFVPTEGVAAPQADSSHVPAFSSGQKVQLPSGRIALVLRVAPVGGDSYATVRTLHRGRRVQGSLPCEVLRDAQLSRVCTV